MMKKFNTFFFLCCVTLLHAKQIEVCTSCEISTIKNAVQMAEDGDEIFIRKGIYKENDIEVNKALTIYGEEGTVIDGQNLSGLLHITSDNIVIKNMKLINVGVSYTKDFAAIKISRCKNFTIENIVLDKIFFGILIEKSHY